MAMTRGDVQMQTSTQGGFMAGLKRSLGGESFFVNDFTSATGGVVAVAAALPGDMAKATVAGTGALLVQSGSWIASDPDITVDAKWGGGKTFFSGEGLILLRCTGQGEVLVSAYGAILSHDLTAGEVITLDTGHVVAFDDTVTYKVRKGDTLGAIARRLGVSVSHLKRVNGIKNPRHLQIGQTLAAYRPPTSTS